MQPEMLIEILAGRVHYVVFVAPAVTAMVRDEIGFRDFARVGAEFGLVWRKADQGRHEKMARIDIDPAELAQDLNLARRHPQFLIQFAQGAVFRCFR